MNEYCKTCELLSKYVGGEIVPKEQYKNTIILYDQDAEECYAVIRTKEDPKRISDIFDKVKEELPGEWSFDDLMEGLMDSGIDYEIDEEISYINF